MAQEEKATVIVFHVIEIIKKYIYLVARQLQIDSCTFSKSHKRSCLSLTEAHGIGFQVPLGHQQEIEK